MHTQEKSKLLYRLIGAVLIVAAAVNLILLFTLRYAYVTTGISEMINESDISIKLIEIITGEGGSLSNRIAEMFETKAAFDTGFIEKLLLILFILFNLLNAILGLLNLFYLSNKISDERAYYTSTSGLFGIQFLLAAIAGGWYALVKSVEKTVNDVSGILGDIVGISFTTDTMIPVVINLAACVILFILSYMIKKNIEKN